jgi:hypothetical protein
MKEFKLVKPKAKNEIIVKSDKEDDWFVYIIHVEKKTGKEVSKTMIIQKDLDQFLKTYDEKGWVKEVKEKKSK